MLTHPNLVRLPFMRCGGVHLEQGDVLHWGTACPSGRRPAGSSYPYSDDLLWLPLITAEYVRKNRRRGIS